MWSWLFWGNDKSWERLLILLIVSILQPVLPLTSALFSHSFVLLLSALFCKQIEAKIRKPLLKNEITLCSKFQSLKIRSIDTKSRTHHRVPKYKGFALTFYGASLINVQFTLSRVGGTSLRHHKYCEYCPNDYDSPWTTLAVSEWQGHFWATVERWKECIWKFEIELQRRCQIHPLCFGEISLQASYAVGDLCDDRELVSSGGFDKREQANLHKLNTAATWINKNFCISRIF